jgi:hypothetical protein
LAEGQKQSDRMAGEWSRSEKLLQQATRIMGEAFVDAVRRREEVPAKVQAPAPARQTAAPPRHVPSRTQAGEKIPLAERKVLTALAHYPDGRTKIQTALLCGYAHSGGGFNNALSALRSKGWIDGSGDQLRTTDAGALAIGPVEALPTGRELQQYWLGQLGKAERLILETLIEAWPNPLTKEEVAFRAGYGANGGGFNNALSRLRTFELISGRGDLRASEVLFE